MSAAATAAMATMSQVNSCDAVDVRGALPCRWRAVCVRDGLSSHVEQVERCVEPAVREPFVGAVVVAEIAVTGDQRNTCRRPAPPACRVRRRRRTRIRPGSTPMVSAACSSGIGCGLRSDNVSPLTTARARVCSFDLDQQRIGEPAGLVGDDAPGEAAALELASASRRRLRTARVCLASWLAIDVEQPHAHRFVFGRPAACRIRAAPARGRHARPGSARFRRAAAARLLLGAQLVQRIGHVVRGVEQRAVEIEQHALDGRPSWRRASRRARCMR